MFEGVRKPYSSLVEMNDRIDRVPELMFCRDPLPEKGSYKVTKTGYKCDHQHIIIRQAEFRGEPVFVRWKIQRGNQPAVTHPDWILYQRQTDYAPSKAGPHKVQNPKKVAGAMAFKNVRKGKKKGDTTSDEYRAHEELEDVSKDKMWSGTYEEEQDTETNSEYEARMEAEEESKWRSYAPAPHYNY